MAERERKFIYVNFPEASNKKEGQGGSVGPILEGY